MINIRLLCSSSHQKSMNNINFTLMQQMQNLIMHIDSKFEQLPIQLFLLILLNIISYLYRFCRNYMCSYDSSCYKDREKHIEELGGKNSQHSVAKRVRNKRLMIYFEYQFLYFISIIEIYTNNKYPLSKVNLFQLE